MVYAYVLALAAKTKDRVSILDWGGGIGHYYVLSKALLPDVGIDYHCKDLPLLCQHGRTLFPEATFYEDDEKCFEKTYDLVLASSSLQYSQDWERVASRLASVSRPYLLISRLPIVHSVPSFVAVQRAYPYGYQTEYLGWHLNRETFLNHVTSRGMELVREFLIFHRPHIHNAPEQGEDRGFLFKATQEGIER
jgi:putative methyltransferase (TIGR04325 family)